eukprot:3647082-Prymnesium_polylepis.1
MRPWGISEQKKPKAEGRRPARRVSSARPQPAAPSASLPPLRAEPSSTPQPRMPYPIPSPSPRRCTTAHLETLCEERAGTAPNRFAPSPHIARTAEHARLSCS